MLQKKLVFPIIIFLFSLNLSALNSLKYLISKRTNIYNLVCSKSNNKILFSLNDQEDPTFYIVKPKETKYSLSKKFGMTVEQLEQLNPNIVSGLKVGDKIRIKSITNPNNQPFLETKQTTPKNVVTEKKNPKPIESTLNQNSPGKTAKLTSENYIDYVIKPKETLYNLSKKAGISIDEFIKINPKLNDAVSIGMIIKMPKNRLTTLELSENQNLLAILESVNKNETVSIAKPIVEKTSSLSESNKNLMISADKNLEKSLFVIMPFNQTDRDRLNKSAQNLDPKTKKQLDFLKGSELAINNTKKQGLKLNVQWISVKDLESQKTIQDKIKNSGSGILWISDRSNDIDLMETFASESCPIIYTNPEWNNLKNTNTFNALPTSISESIKVIEYIKSKNGNVIIIQDRKNTDLITKYIPDAKFIIPNEKGQLNTGDLGKSLSQKQTNFVILDTAKNGLIITTTTALLEEVRTNTIQLVVLESNKIPNSEKISENRLKILKMIYPSTKIENSESSKISKSQIFQNIEKPSLNLLKGYDVTFDTILRLFQKKSFKEIAESTDSEQLTTRFEYQKNNSGSYFNGGIRIMQMDDIDSPKTIKP